MLATQYKIRSWTDFLCDFRFGEELTCVGKRRFGKFARLSSHAAYRLTIYTKLFSALWNGAYGFSIERSVYQPQTNHIRHFVLLEMAYFQNLKKSGRTEKFGTTRNRFRGHFFTRKAFDQIFSPVITYCCRDRSKRA